MKNITNILAVILLLFAGFLLLPVMTKKRLSYRITG